MKRILFAALALVLMHTGAASAEEESEQVFEGSEDVFKSLREDYYEGYAGDTVEDVIKKFFEEGEVDEGSYPASEFWEHDGELRRELPERISYNGRVFFKYSNDDISMIEKYEKELELNAGFGDWDGYFRISDENAFARNADPLRIEKLRIRHRQGDHKFTVGSFGALFGRGLALNMFEERFLDFDNEVEGVKAEFDLDDAYVTALWGTRKNRNQPFHSEVSAARVEVPVVKGLTLGGHVVNVQFPSSAQPSDGAKAELDYDLVGANIDARIGDFRLYGETVQLDRKATTNGNTRFDVDGLTGKGFYLNAGIAGDGYAFSAEYKDYWGLTQPFTTLPPLRRWNEQAQAEPDDDVGYAFELILNPFDDGSLFTFDYAQSNSELIKNPYSEFIVVYAGPSGRKLSYVVEYLDINFHGDKRIIQRATLNRAIDEDWTAGTYFEHERFRIDGAEDHTDYIVEFDLAYQSEWTIVYTTERTGLDLGEGAVESWSILELKYRPDEDQEFNLVSGSRREGFVCSGGVCRLEPAFDGIRLDYLRRF